MRQFIPLLRDIKNTAQISGDSWMTSDNNSRGILPANTKSEPFMTIRWIFCSKPYPIFFRNNGKWSHSPRVVAQICTDPSARSQNADEKIRAKIFSWQRRPRRVVALYSWENTWMTTLKELDQNTCFNYRLSIFPRRAALSVPLLVLQETLADFLILTVPR